MRGSLGATKREHVLSESDSRQVVLVNDRERGKRVVRRISASEDGPDLVDRAIALGLIRQVRIPGFAFIEDRALVGATLEIAEQYVEGFTLARAAEAIREQITVSVAIALVYDIALGLELLHSVVEPSGRPASLVHGRIGLDQVMLTATGDVRVIGLDGRRGDASADVQDLLKLLHTLLVSKASSRAGSALLARLAQLEFESAEQMTAALSAYLGKQSSEDVASKRAAFASEVAKRVLDTEPPEGRATDEHVHRIQVPETPTDTAQHGEAQQFPKRAVPAARLGVSAAVQMDEEDGPTVTDGPTVDDSQESTIDSAEALPIQQPLNPGEARQGLLAPAAQQKPEVKWTGADRSVSVGNYRVVASIGRGGMGEIYLARSNSEHYQGLVALKVLGPEDSGDDEALGMFIDEASIMARIDHPNVLKVVDFGRAKGRHFLAMEYLEGRPLVRVMIDAYQRETGLDYGVIAAIGADAARGLFAAHTATAPDGSPLKVVHRDISPQNIFVTYRGITKVIDFGVARATQRVSKTAVGVVKGKAAYMSPEQTEGKEVDARSDVFSLGVCLWEMTAGRRLFKRETEYETLLAVSTAPIERPTAVRGKPNPVLDRVILNALTRNREKRTQSALELAAQLTEYAQGVGLKEPHGSVADLMQRLFGAVAAEEQKLIRSFEARAASEEEADSLRKLSGVSPKRGVKQEVTLVGTPSALLELDNFGEGSESGAKKPELAAKPKSASGAAPLDKAKPVSAFDKPKSGQFEKPLSAFDKPKSGPFDKPLSAFDKPKSGPFDKPLSAFDKPKSGQFDKPLSAFDKPKSGPFDKPLSAFDKPKSEKFPAPFPSAFDKPKSGPFDKPLEKPGDVVLRAVEAIKAEQAATVPFAQVHDPTPTPLPAFPAQGAPVVPQPSISSPQVIEESGSVPAIEIDDTGFEVIGSVSGTVVPVDERPRSGVSAPPTGFGEEESSTTTKRPLAKGQLAKGSVERRLVVYGLAVALVLTFAVIGFVWRKSGETASNPQPARDPPVTTPRPAPDPAPPSLAQQPAPAIDRVSTATSSVRDLIEDIGARGLNVTASEGTFLIIDKRKDSVVIDKNASVLSVEGADVRGWIAQTTKRGLTRVVWVGSIAGGPWFARALSVNDCPASASVSAEGIVLSYGSREVQLPHGGGELLDVALARPPFAKRLELQPLGLSFGKKATSLDVLPCTIGWWGQQVVLRSMPHGRYTLRWIGETENETQEAELEVTATDVKGGRLVRTSSGAR